MKPLDVINKLLEEAHKRYSIGSEIPREEVIAWIESRPTHWSELREASCTNIAQQSLHAIETEHSGERCAKDNKKDITNG